MRRRAGVWILLLMAIAAIAVARPRLVARSRGIKVGSDVFALPPPELLAVLSLGYRSALADLIYTSTVVSYGIHGEEHRRFEFVGQYLESIASLDPKFCQTYRYADTFIIFQAVGTPGPDEVRTAKRLLDQGLANCPSDGPLWLSAGQFMAFIGTQFLTDEKEKQELRAAGARALSRAAELATENHNVQWQALGAAGIFTQEGSREAAIAFLERVYSVTDDEELKANVAAKLGALQQDRALDRARQHAQEFSEVWRDDLPFVTRTELLVVGPPVDPAACAGGDGEEPACTENWADWRRVRSLD